MSSADEAGPGPENTEQQTQPFTIGATVDGSDGELGELARVIVDPVKQALTHIVVSPSHGHEQHKLLPIELVEEAASERIRVRATAAEFEQLDAADDVQFLPGGADWAGYGSDVMTWPYYGIGAPLGGAAPGAQGAPVFVDRVPAGEVEVKRGDPVHATDGHVGSVQGLVVDRKDHHVTHVLLKEGHLWGRKQVAIPIGATSRVEDEIRVGLTKQQIEDLPPVDLESTS